MKRGRGWASIVTCLLLCSILPVSGQESSLRFPESRSYSPGKLWLEWSSGERVGFVKGFIIGHAEGYKSGCRTADTGDSRRVGRGFDPCLQQRHLFQKDAQYYEQLITDFYNRYAMDRDVPVRVLLQQVNEKTPDEVHQWLAQKPE